MPNFMKVVWERMDEFVIDALRADLARMTEERDEATRGLEDAGLRMCELVCERDALRARVTTLEADNARLREAIKKIVYEWDTDLGSKLKYFGSGIDFELVVAGNLMQDTIAAAEAELKGGK